MDLAQAKEICHNLRTDLPQPGPELRMEAVLIGEEAIERIEDMRDGIITNPERKLDHETRGSDDE